MNIETEVKELLHHLETGGKYYKHGAIESIDFIESIGDLEGMARANAIDYLVRYKEKWKGNPVEQKKDLYKAIHHILFLARAINEKHEMGGEYGTEKVRADNKSQGS